MVKSAVSAQLLRDVRVSNPFASSGSASWFHRRSGCFDPTQSIQFCSILHWKQSAPNIGKNRRPPAVVNQRKGSKASWSWFILCLCKYGIRYMHYIYKKANKGSYNFYDEYYFHRLSLLITKGMSTLWHFSSGCLHFRRAWLPKGWGPIRSWDWCFLDQCYNTENKRKFKQETKDGTLAAEQICNLVPLCHIPIDPESPTGAYRCTNETSVDKLTSSVAILALSL